MPATKSATIGTAMPAFANELVAALVAAGRSEMAATVHDLPIVSRCRCGDSNCATFHTVAGPEERVGTSMLLDLEGMVVIDHVDHEILTVEVLDRPRVRDALRAVLL